MIDKRALRTRLRADRDSFVADVRPTSLPAHPRFLERLRPGGVVASYAAVGSETDPAGWTAAARAAGCTIVLPFVVDLATPLRFLRWPQGAALVAGPFGLANPAADWDEVAPDTIVAPLLGFDAALNRIGHGAGYYDRAFVDHPGAWRVGLGWSVQQVATLPIDPWDVPLHAVATERGWLGA